METTRAERLILNGYFLVVFVGIGGLQMYHVDAGFVTQYGADLLAPPYLYVVSRRGRLRFSPAVALGTVLGCCVLWEVAQRWDFTGTPLVITRGTFDPYDLVAYAAGLLACCVADVRWFAGRASLPKQRAT